MLIITIMVEKMRRIRWRTKKKSNKRITKRTIKRTMKKIMKRIMKTGRMKIMRQANGIMNNCQANQKRTLTLDIIIIISCIVT